jgi:hypothetical protein
VNALAVRGTLRSMRKFDVSDKAEALPVRAALWLVVALATLIVSAPSARAADSATKGLSRTPFESGPNTDLLSRLAKGDVVRRSSLDGTLTADDRARVRALGLERLDGAAVVLRFVPKIDPSRQLDRLRALTRFVEGFMPSGLCDSITAEGESRGLCTGTVDGPLGKALVRLPFTTELREGAAGAASFSLRNMRPVEAKGFLSWTRLVDSNRLRFAVDLYPADAGWYVYTRFGVEMSSHASEAKTIAEQILKLDAWLSHELRQT